MDNSGVRLCRPQKTGEMRQSMVLRWVTREISGLSPSGFDSRLPSGEGAIPAGQGLHRPVLQ